jgi:hypothetical protein
MIVMRTCKAALLFLFSLFAQRAFGAPFLLDVEADWIGLGFKVGYKGLELSPAADTIISLSLLGVYDSSGYFRTPDGQPYEGGLPGLDAATSPYASRFTLRSALEIDQGLLWNERDRSNRLEAFLIYKLRYEVNRKDAGTSQLLFDSSLPDRDQILQSSVLLGLEWKDVDHGNPHRLLSGTGVEASIECGPRWFFNGIGEADFVRFSLSTRAFLPLFDIDPESPLNRLSACMGFFLAVDYVTGTSVPLNVRETFGGRYPRKGLGYAVRGLEDCRYDSPFKAVANADLRLSLPAIAVPGLIPGLLWFIDAGYYNFVDFPVSGVVFSTGGGISLSLFDVFNLTLTTRFLLNTTRVTGGFWEPLFFAFIFHF